LQISFRLVNRESYPGPLVFAGPRNILTADHAPAPHAVAAGNLIWTRVIENQKWDEDEEGFKITVPAEP
jgi:hypothetical protein